MHVSVLEIKSNFNQINRIQKQFKWLLREFFFLFHNFHISFVLFVLRFVNASISGVPFLPFPFFCFHLAKVRDFQLFVNLLGHLKCSLERIDFLNGINISTGTHLSCIISQLVTPIYLSSSYTSSAALLLPLFFFCVWALHFYDGDFQVGLVQATFRLDQRWPKSSLAFQVLVVWLSFRKTNRHVSAHELSVSS